MSNESYVIKHERCPKCALNGKDVSHDNFAVYSDGHSYCFSCGYSILPSKLVSFKERQKGEEQMPKVQQVFLPQDCSIDYPQRAVQWIQQYDLTKTDLLNHNVMWSEAEQRLIFPIYGDGNLIAWQGRSFNLNKGALLKVPKWFGRGNLKDTYNILGKGDKLVLTEDVVSAIKVSKCDVMAMPLYGCVVGERFKRLYNLFGNQVEVDVWLDPDKRKEALIEAKLGRVYGLRCKVVFSEVDPKELSCAQIKETLNG